MVSRFVGLGSILSIDVPPGCRAHAENQHVAIVTVTVGILCTLVVGQWLLRRIAHLEVEGRLYGRELGHLVLGTLAVLRLPGAMIGVFRFVHLLQHFIQSSHGVSLRV